MFLNSELQSASQAKLQRHLHETVYFHFFYCKITFSQSPI